MKNALKYASRAAAGLLPAVLLVRVSMPVLVALVLIAVFMLGVICWVISSGDRADRVTRMILAGKGNAGCLTPSPSAPSSPASRSRRARPARHRSL